MIETIKLNQEIGNVIKNSTSTEEFVEGLSGLGFNANFFSLKGKGYNLLEMRDGIKEEEERLRYNPDATQFGWLADPYTRDQVVLVRTTADFSIGNFLAVPKDGQLTSHAAIATMPAYYAALRHLGFDREKMDSDEFKANKALIKETEDKMTPLLRQYRSTKHFTLNTLVAPNSGGDWSGMPYIYFERMIHHLNDKNLAHIAPHDTFFRGDVQLVEPTLMLKQQDLEKLLATKDPAIIDTLKQTTLYILENNCEETASIPDHVGYFLREVMNSPYYYCNDHGVNIQSNQGVYATIRDEAKEKGITWGGDHCHSKEKEMDTLHFTRNIAEDYYRYLVFVAGNDKFNLTDEQKEIMNGALERYHSSTKFYTEKRGVRFDFTEENTPAGKYFSDDEGKEYQETIDGLHDLIAIVEDAFVYSKFYETVDTTVLIEETTRYNEEYAQELASNPDFEKTLAIKQEDLVGDTPTE